MTKVALLCSGLGNVLRGHEVFAADLFALLKDDLDITLYKGGGQPTAREIVIPHAQRRSPSLDGMHLPVAPKWHAAAVEVERMRIEGESFAWGALDSLLSGEYDVIHCLEQEVCNTLYAQRHLFAKTPKFLWSNGGAIPAHAQPRCDYVQEHSDNNLVRSVKGKAFVIPHGVDMNRFRPDVQTDFRQRHGIPADAFVVISVGSICYWHKRMDYIIREVASLPNPWLVIVGQETADTPGIKQLGDELMRGRIVFTSMSHDQLPQAYAAADVFALGSIFETFGIVYIEAMAMGLPVISTDHPNQRSIIKEAVFIDMKQSGTLAAALKDTPASRWKEIGLRGLEVARTIYDLDILQQRYLDKYAEIACTPVTLPRYTLGRKLASNIRSALPALDGWLSRNLRGGT
ncbi:MAG: glycosyltransferase family 4 protein [Rhodocyclaceae bacterium]